MKTKHYKKWNMTALLIISIVISVIGYMLFLTQTTMVKNMGVTLFVGQKDGIPENIFNKIVNNPWNLDKLITFDMYGNLYVRRDSIIYIAQVLDLTYSCCAFAVYSITFYGCIRFYKNNKLPNYMVLLGIVIMLIKIILSSIVIDKINYITLNRKDSLDFFAGTDTISLIVDDKLFGLWRFDNPTTNYVSIISSYTRCYNVVMAEHYLFIPNIITLVIVSISLSRYKKLIKNNAYTVELKPDQQ